MAPASALADTVTDTSFIGGTTGSTWITESGQLQLTPALAETFAGDTLPAGLVETVYGPGGEATVAGGEVAIDGARVGTTATAGPGRVVEFRAKLSGDPNQHFGLGDDFNAGPWAMFSTRGGNEGLWVRTRTGTLAASVDTLVVGVDPLLVHTYRIEWTATDVRFFVDDQEVVVPTGPVAITDPMRPLVSDANAAGGDVKVERLIATPYAASGTFESGVFDVTDNRARWDALTATGGTGVTFETRSGTTPGALSEYQPLGAGGAIASPAGRYIQYRATLTTADPMTSPALTGVTLAYAVDADAPVTAVDPVTVSGTSATVGFSSAAADVARFECSVDGGAFATCTSPHALTGLAAGAHAVAVRAIDTVGNTGQAESRGFTVASPPPPPPVEDEGDQPKDIVAPVIGINSRRIDAGRRAALRLTCPATEINCRIDVRLKYGKRSAGRARITIAGGETRTVRVKLTQSARKRLAERGRLKVVALITATDAAGNSEPQQMTLTLRAR